MAAITRMEVKGWVEELKLTTTRRGTLLSADMVHQCVNLMSGMYRDALDETPPVVLGNPFKGLRNLPEIPPAPILYYTDEECEAIAGAVARDSDRVMVELGFWSGLRPGELFGLRGDRVNWLRGGCEITHVQTRAGMREYPKTAKSHRTVPIRPATMDAMREFAPHPLDGLVFVTREGCAIDDSNFRHRVWAPAVARAGLPDYSPRAMRHTAATRLVMQGVDLYRVQDLLGHEKLSTTQRYAHLVAGKHDAILQAWDTPRTRRTG